MTQATKPAFDREYQTVDKSAWKRGPWDDEPDKAQWIDQATGLDCLLVRNMGALCGYVGVPPEHPWHSKDYGQHIGVHPCDEEFCYDHTPGGMVRVHGGLTFAAACADTEDESKHICHVPEPGRPHDVWWFGFDCAHSGDLNPAFENRFTAHDHDVYRDVGYVQAECARVAEQLAAVSA